MVAFERPAFDSWPSQPRTAAPIGGQDRGPAPREETLVVGEVAPVGVERVRRGAALDRHHLEKGVARGHRNRRWPRPRRHRTGAQRSIASAVATAIWRASWSSPTARSARRLATSTSGWHGLGLAVQHVQRVQHGLAQALGRGRALEAAPERARPARSPSAAGAVPARATRPEPGTGEPTPSSRANSRSALASASGVACRQAATAASSSSGTAWLPPIPARANSGVSAATSCWTRLSRARLGVQQREPARRRQRPVGREQRPRGARRDREQRAVDRQIGEAPGEHLGDQEALVALGRLPGRRQQRGQILRVLLLAGRPLGHRPRLRAPGGAHAGERVAGGARAP